MASAACSAMARFGSEAPAFNSTVLKWIAAPFEHRRAIEAALQSLIAKAAEASPARSSGRQVSFSRLRFNLKTAIEQRAS